MKGTLVAFSLTALLLLSNAGAHTDGVQAQTTGETAPQARASSAELAEANRLNAVVARLFKEGKYDEALPVASRVLAIREQALASDHELVAVSLSNLAEIYTKQKRYAEAAGLLARLLAIAEKKTGSESLRTAKVLDRLGSVQLWENKMAAAEASLTRAVSIKEKLLAPDHVELAPSLFSLAEYYAHRADYRKATPLYQRSIAIWDKRLDKKDPGLIKVIDRYICLLGGEEQLEELRGFLQGRREYRVGDLLLADGVAYGQVQLTRLPIRALGNSSFISYGRAVIKTLVDETGKVVKAEMICGDAALSQPTIGMALKEHFNPPLSLGKPARVSAILIYRYGDHMIPMPTLP